ncbi:hypothetical protein [Nocardia sp. NRRL S-836]|nr:hypothetical protein [Nocardia sp. NRRL S-836]
MLLVEVPLRTRIAPLTAVRRQGPDALLVEVPLRTRVAPLAKVRWRT